MTKRKLLTGLASAGVFSAGFGAAVLPASAELRMLTVTLLGGTTTQVAADVPPGTPLEQVTIPGITVPIIGISDAGPVPTDTTAPASTTDASTDTVTAEAPAPAAPAPAAADPAAPATPTDPATPGTPMDPLPGDVPVAGTQDQQKTTGSKQAKDTSGDKAAAAPSKAKPKPKAPADAPTPADPTYSFAIPGPAPIGVPNFFIEKFRIPPFLLSIYQAAGIQYGVRWEILAAINEIETDYGRNLNVSTAGALGWMQFLPSTFKRWGVDANSDGHKDPYNPVDAIFSAARYLKAAGADSDVKKAIFAYNHASWYVDSVLMRARLIGGLPSDLVGSLTGLTQGHFPVHATARYADDVTAKDAKKRVAKGTNAAVPIQADAGRKSVDIYAKAGSPAIAVQDGKIVRIGRTKALGRFIQLRDVYGNTYTYAGLKKLAKAHPVPKEQTVSKAQVRHELDLPKKDPKPTAPASAGTQVRKAAAPARKTVRRTPAATSSASSTAKERLFANPARPNARKAGGEEQLLASQAGAKGGDVFKSYFTEVYGLKTSDVTIKPLRVGSKVIAGTILGRLGRTSAKRSPHVRFEIRPAGKDAPLIDPKPILDGWKLLESTAIYRAAGKNPFLGPDAKNASIGQILLMSKEALQRRVLADSRVDTYTCGRRDIEAGVVDRRVLATVEFLSASGLDPTITSLRCGHGRLTSSGNVSEHSTGTAVDIAAVNGIPILGHQGPGSITDLTIRRLLTLQGSMKPHQIISLMTYDGADNTLSMPDHADHIHIGFQPLYGSNSKLSRQLDSVLKPGQWTKLIDRLGAIDNPTVLTSPSKYAIDAKPRKDGRASDAHKGE
jgi:soluble lytic murein transglycosylase-like protein